MPSLFHNFLLLHCLALATALKCPVAFDGRVPSNFTVTAFDTKNGIWNPDNVFGKELKLSEVVQLPKIKSSLFDNETSSIPVEVTLNDKSIFAPSATNIQSGFRRAELLHATNNGTDPSTSGVKTLHFSIMKDAAKPLNLTHEYQLVFLEDSSFSTNQIVLKTGTVIGSENSTGAKGGNGTTGEGSPADMLRWFGNVNAQPAPVTLFSTPFTKGIWHNFAVTLDFEKNTTQFYYSQEKGQLKNYTAAVPNDVHGKGQFHFGVLKKGLGGGGDPKKGTQEAGISEGMVYGGVFLEDSAGDCVSLGP